MAQGFVRRAPGQINFDELLKKKNIFIARRSEKNVSFFTLLRVLMTL